MPYKDPIKQKEAVEKCRQNHFNKIRSILSNCLCQVCGESDDSCLDFHHLVPKEKEVNISELVSNQRMKTFIREIVKCMPLCSNCHRKFHAGKVELPDFNINEYWNRILNI